MIIKINDQTFETSLMDVHFPSYFYRKVIEYNNITINGYVIAYPYMAKNCHELRVLIKFLQLAFPESRLEAGLYCELYDRKLKQMKRVLSMLGNKPFPTPHSLWEVDVNNIGVVLPRCYKYKSWLEKAGFQILPYPMFMGNYDKDYKKILVGIPSNNNGGYRVKVAWKEYPLREFA